MKPVTSLRADPAAIKLHSCINHKVWDKVWINITKNMFFEYGMLRSEIRTTYGRT